jgi:hypothetical protein
VNANTNAVEDDFDYCKQCKRIVPEGTEHDSAKHLSSSVVHQITTKSKEATK